MEWSGERHETRLVADTLEGRFTKAAPPRFIGDRAYDSDAVDEELLVDFGVKLISPHRVGRRRLPTPVEVERLFAWLLRFRRIVTGWEVSAENSFGFVQLGYEMLSSYK